MLMSRTQGQTSNARAFAGDVESRFTKDELLTNVMLYWATGTIGSSFQRWTAMPRGGHFAALEEPTLLAEDIRAFFRPMRSLARR